MPTQVIRYVDPDAAGAGNGTSWADAYTALQTCLNSEATDLQVADEYLTIYCRSSSGTDDTTLVTSLTQTNYNTDATHYVEIIQSDFPSDGVWDATKYVLFDNNTGSAALTISANFVRIRNLQIIAKQSIAPRYCIQVISVPSGGSDIRVDSCILKGSTAVNNLFGIYVNDADATLNIYNSILYNFPGTNGCGINLNAGVVNAYNVTVYGCTAKGFTRSSGTFTCINCISANNGDDFSGTITVDHCCSDDGDGTNAQTPSAGNWANEFTDAASGDFSLLVGGNCVGNGIDDPGSGLYGDDIIGTTRSSTWDIGAFECTEPTPPVPPSPTAESGNLFLMGSNF